MLYSDGQKKGPTTRLFGDRTLRAILYRGVLCFVTFTLLNSISSKLIFVNIVISYFTKLSRSTGICCGGPSFVNLTKGGLLLMLTGSQGRQRARTDEQREAYNAYQRRYRAEHRDKARQWQTNYIIRRAARLAAEAAGQAEQAKTD